MGMNSFAEDVYKGLTAFPKFIAPKYFYDEEGSRIFTHITGVEEYYPTRCEFEILSAYKQRILTLIQQFHHTFRIVELGAGDGMKTKVLLNHFLIEQADFTYVPIDICEEENAILKEDLSKLFPQLKVEPLTGEFMDAMTQLVRSPEGKLILFLGSTIGNLSPQDTLAFLRSLRSRMNKNDLLLIGFDLKKHPRLIADAYNDSKGLTRDFNLNLLKRMNRELGANFNLELFEHYPMYDPNTGEARSYLVSRAKQKVYIKELDKEFGFNEGEVIFTEVSRKFSMDDIQELAADAGFKVLENFMDMKEYFVDSLWKK
jgi:L-histidine Nalpha-methyltransferase